MANVNRPTDQAQKEKDINTKLQFYGISEAFANGKVPSNKQIDIALNSLLRSRALSSPSKRLSSEGRDLVADVRDVINEAKKLLLSKNQGNLIQDFVWEAQHIDGANAGTPNAPISKDTAQQHGDQALDGLKTLGRLILSNGQFRKLLDDALVLARDIAGDAAQKTASKVNPSEDRLKSIDEPAEDNTWHEVPDLSKDSIKQRASSAYETNKPFSREDAKEAARDGANTAQNHPSSGTDSSRAGNQQAGKEGANTAMQNLKAKAQSNVPDETQENIRKTGEAASQRSKNYLNEKIPQERRDQTVYRLKKMIVEIQGHSDYQEAVETLLNLAEEYGRHGKNLTQQTAGTVQQAHGDSSLQRTEKNLKTLIERFANFTSTDDLFESLNQIYRDAEQDPELRKWFRDVNTFVRKALREQGYVLKESSDKEWDRLYDKAQFLFRDRYRDHADHIVDELKFLADQFEQDPQNQAFARVTEKLFLDLGRDENGKATFKPHLIKDLTDVVIPAIFENTRYVPIPRIEFSDPMIDLVIENLVIESDNLFPNSLEFSTDNYWKFGRKSIGSKRQNKVMIAGSGIQMDLRDVAYYMKKKQGFPSITDKGVMDIILAGQGFSFKIAARNAYKGSDSTHFIAIDNVDVVIHDLQIKIKKSNHKLLFSIAKSLVLKVMKPAIQKAIEKAIKDNFEKADAYAYDIYREVQKGAEQAKKNPDQANNIYQQYVSAFQKKAMQKKKKADNAAKNTEVNIAMTKEDSMFKHISLPGGISTKATEYKQLAAKGDRWESPIFGIGSASESTDIPRATEVRRKPHSTREAGIRGGNHPNANTNTSGSSGRSAPGSGSLGLGSSTGGTSGIGAGATSAATSGYPSGTSGGYGTSSAIDSRYGSGTTGEYTGPAATSASGYGTGLADRSAAGYNAGLGDRSAAGYGATGGNTGYGTASSTGYGNTGGLGGLSSGNTGGLGSGYTDSAGGYTITGQPPIGSTGQNVPSGFTSEVDQALNPAHNTTYYDSATRPGS